MVDRHFVYVTEADLSIDHGRGINEREFVRALLSRYADEVTCIVPSPQEPDNFSDPALEYVSPHRQSGLHYPRFLLSAWNRLVQVHGVRPVDALVTRLDVSPVIPYLAQRRLGLPVILKTLVSRQSFRDEPASSSRPHDLVKRIFRGMFRAVIEQAVAADTVSRPLAEGLRHEFGFTREDLVVIPNGANMSVFRPRPRNVARAELGLTGFEHLVGYVGKVSELRHVDAIVRSVAALSNHRDVGLLVVGEGDGMDALREECRRANIADRVRFTGWVPYGEVPLYMAALDVGVDLSRIPLRFGGDTRFASYSQKIAQYLGTGTAVVAWDLEDTRFLQANGIGRVAPFGDVGALSVAIDKLLDDNGREERRQASRRYAAENLSISELTDARVSLWREAIMDRRVRQSA